MFRRSVLIRLALFAVVLLIPQWVPAQESATGQEGTLIALERMWNQAQILRDAGALRHLVGDNFVNTEWDGTVSDRQKFLADIKDPLYKPSIMSIHDVSVQFYGSTAIVVGTYHTKGVYNDKPYDHVGRFTDTWILDNGRWVCVASHSSLIQTR